MHHVLTGSLEGSVLISREKVLRNHDTLFLGSKFTHSVDQDWPISWFSCWPPEASFLHCPNCLFCSGIGTRKMSHGDQKVSELTTEGAEDQEIDTSGLRVSVTLEDTLAFSCLFKVRNGLCPYGQHRICTGRGFC